MIRLLEDNVDREIVELKTSFEKQLYEEREVNIHLRGQEFVTKKRFIRSVADNVVYYSVIGPCLLQETFPYTVNIYCQSM